MNPTTGTLYDSLEQGLRAGERREDLVELIATPAQAQAISAAVTRDHRARQRARAKRKTARASRRHNRRP